MLERLLSIHSFSELLIPTRLQIIGYHILAKKLHFVLASSTVALNYRKSEHV